MYTLLIYYYYTNLEYVDQYEKYLCVFERIENWFILFYTILYTHIYIFFLIYYVKLLLFVDYLHFF